MKRNITITKKFYFFKNIDKYFLTVIIYCNGNILQKFEITHYNLNVIKKKYKNIKKLYNKLLNLSK